tara:strand:- start:219 stop:1019 length:801 start_codon:yes stop_codon:yes gene_type:complete
MKKIILFDMDGTLTPPRGKININVEQCLMELQRKGFEIGIVTGSGMNYVRQQLSPMFDLSLADTSKIHFLPCNGTKYILNEKIVYEMNMKDYMGDNLWHRLVSKLIKNQNNMSLDYGRTLPLSGHFIDYRGSMINWCPIGRNSTPSQREEWSQLDEGNKIRLIAIQELNIFLENCINQIGDLPASDVQIEVKLGGDTSFDIFPKGWDKTFCLKNFKDFDKIYFIGDRCGQNGNDYEIFNHPDTISFKTISTENTIEIVNKILSSNV